MYIWKDVTTFSKGDTIREPKSLEVIIAGKKVVIHKHIDYGSDWLLTCHSFGIERKILFTSNLEEAKVKAIQTLKIYLNDKINQFANAVNEINTCMPSDIDGCTTADIE